MELDLETIKHRVESLAKIHQIEILRILKNAPGIKINENKSGVFVNLSFLPKDTIANITRYIQYIQEQERALQMIESQKNAFKTEFFKEEASERI
jgi:uncharacterized protein with ACT and thioredoxin-like domain